MQRKSERGATSLEYSLLLALILIPVLSALYSLNSLSSDSFWDISSSMYAAISTRGGAGDPGGGAGEGNRGSGSGGSGGETGTGSGSGRNLPE